MAEGTPAQVRRSMGSSSFRQLRLGSENTFGSRRHVDEEEMALKWAAIERLPTLDRLSTAILKYQSENGCGMAHQVINVKEIGFQERQKFMDKLIRMAEEDNERFLQQLRSRIDRVGMKLPTIEVRYENLTVDAKCHVGKRSLPTLWNATRNTIEEFLDIVGLSPYKKEEVHILKSVSGIIKPGRSVFDTNYRIQRLHYQDLQQDIIEAVMALWEKALERLQLSICMLDEIQSKRV